MRKTKNENAYDIVKDLIIREKLDLGKMLSIAALAERIGMGRAPVIDAVKRLESEGFLSIMPRQGFLIREMSVQEMRSINETRMVLETYIMERIAPVFTEKDARKLRTFMDDMRTHAAENNFYEFIVSDHAMHMYLYELCDNLCMVDILRNLRDRIFTVGYKIIARREGRMATTIGEHEAILQALERNDPRLAAESMRTHLTNGWKNII